MLRKYIRTKLKYILMAILVLILFFISAILYHVPIKAVIYPIILGVVVNIIFYISDYYKTRKKHNIITNLTNNVESAVFNMTEAKSVEEEDYQKLILILDKERKEKENVSLWKYNDMTEYYTLWAHQIKTPIASMRLTLQNEDSRSARMLISDLSRIEQYVEMVLAYLRLESQSSDYVFKEYDLDDILKNAIKRFSSEFILRKISLVYEPVNYKLIVDEKWFSFVIEQVLSNALKYTIKGNISIYMEGDTLCISDTGIGIQSEDLPRVFERGYTGLNGRIDKKASGIGLYLCKKICDKISIAISIDSCVDKGTTVRCNLDRYNLKKE